ncbi:MAG: hypothetical protein HFG26_09290 [Provencibacterium sp.]|jgi:hypothetical protein|nr:hypothetical protein [Provencibacterium sp.]
MPKDMRTYRGYGRRRYSGRVTFFICLLFVVLLAGVAAALILLNRPETVSGGPVAGLGYDETARVGMLEEGEAGDLLGLDEFQYRLNRTPSAVKGEANWRIENPPENRQLMRVSVRLPDGTVLYETGLIKPYYSIRTGPLLQKLEPGIYNVTAEITVLDAVSREPVSSAEEELVLQVE